MYTTTFGSDARINNNNNVNNIGINLGRRFPELAI